jgi:hypothetical protein
LNYGELMGEGDALRALDAQMDAVLAEAMNQDVQLAHGYLNTATAVDPQAQQETEHSAWLATMARMGLLTPTQLAAARRRVGFTAFHAAVDPEALQR